MGLGYFALGVLGAYAKVSYDNSLIEKNGEETYNAMIKAHEEIERREEAKRIAEQKRIEEVERVKRERLKSIREEEEKKIRIKKIEERNREIWMSIEASKKKNEEIRKRKEELKKIKSLPINCCFLCGESFDEDRIDFEEDCFYCENCGKKYTFTNK